LGVICGLVAGCWLGAAEAPTKLVTTGISPYAISLCMVAGVFVARWTFPTLLKGTAFIFSDLRMRKHLIVWALLAGGLWAVANTLTVIAIRDVGLAVAFPLWNANALVGLIWGRVFFGELKNADTRAKFQVAAGALSIVAAATLLGFSSIHHTTVASGHASHGVAAALGACVLWGTMYIPYRKAYLSGMNPLSFVTAFTIGELFTVGSVSIVLGGGARILSAELHRSQHVLFWLFLGGFFWVVGDLFQHFAAKYLGIGRGIPLSSTNQLWGLAWAGLVFGELRHASSWQQWMILCGSLGMIAGAALLSSAIASKRENTSRNEVVLRECVRYDLDYLETIRAIGGLSVNGHSGGRRWWDLFIMLGALSFFVWLARTAEIPSIPIDRTWCVILGVVLFVSVVAGTYRLWRDTDFN